MTLYKTITEVGSFGHKKGTPYPAAATCLGAYLINILERDHREICNIRCMEIMLVLASKCMFYLQVSIFLAESVTDGIVNP